MTEFESYSGAAVIQSYHAFDAANARFDEMNDEFLDISIKMLKVRSFLMPVVALIGELCVVLVLYFGGRKVLDPNHHYSVGQLGAIAYIGILVNGLRSLGFLVGATQRGYLALDRGYEVLDENPGRTLDGEVPTFTRESATFDIRNLTFTYPGSDSPTLKRVTTTIDT